jgi:hypothetical protein
MAGPGIGILFWLHGICPDWPTFSFTSADVCDRSFALEIWSLEAESWPSQANHIFNRLGITSNFEKYGMSETSLELISSLTCSSSCPGFCQF